MKQAFSMIETVIALTLVGFLFTLSLNILDISVATTESNKIRFLANQKMQNEMAELSHMVHTNEIRYGALRLSECFMDDTYPNDDPCNLGEAATFYFGDALVEGHFFEQDDLKIQKSITKTNNQLELKTVVKFQEAGNEREIQSSKLINLEL